MDRSLLAARIQEILKGRPRPTRPESAPPASPEPDAAGLPAGPRYVEADEEGAFAARCAADAASATVKDLLGGCALDGPGGPCFVVERRYGGQFRHGRHLVARYARAAADGLRTLPWFLGDAGAGELAGLEDAGAPGAPRLVFFDLETTGLSGGAGTYAFLVGCGYFEGEDFVTRQYFLRGFGEERAMLEAITGFVDANLGAACLVTYNGRSFDLPLIDTRYLFHRRTSPFSALPHVDMLFSARRLWRRRALRDLPPDGTGASSLAVGDLRASCALTALEHDVLGLAREDDVPGWEIPGRYFAYTRSGDARGLVAVLEHNRLDLLSLAAVTAVVFEMVMGQERTAGDRQDCVAIARLLEYLGRLPDAERCYAKAAEAPLEGIEGQADRVARAEALHWLALHRRRARQFEEAAASWRALLEIPGLDTDLRREACEALAIHHEHRVRDLSVARAFALGALDSARGGRHSAGVEHRLNRLSRKLRGKMAPGGDAAAGQPVFRMDETPE